MRDAAFYPISSPQQAVYHARQAHHFVYIPALQFGDLTNVWLDPSNNGG